MSEPTARSAARCHHDPYCSRCDLLVGLGGLHVTAVEFGHDADGVGLLTVGVESLPAPMGCTTCGVIAHSHGRRDVTLVDAPCFDRPVKLVWRKRTWRCGEPSCPIKVFTEQDDQVARPRALLTTRACWWAINQIRREHASIRGIARQLGTTWNTVWTSIEPLLEETADDETRFTGVKRLGVDEHVWHHVSEFPIEDGGRGLKLLTGMVDLTPDPESGKPKARLLDLVPGRSGKAYSDWLAARGEDFRDGVEVATLDPFHGYKNAIDDQLEDATAVLDAFHVGKLGTQAVDEVRRRVQQEIHGHRGRKSDPLYGIRTILRCGAEKLTGRQRARLDRAIAADERHDEVLVAGLCAQKLRSAYKATSPVEGRRIAEELIRSLPTCPIPEIKRLGKTLKQWREAFLAYFDTGRANNGCTEAINGLIELHRRVARGFRNREHYRLRMLLIGGGLAHPTSGRKSRNGSTALRPVSRG
ncbi:ISL3 family transposase [Nocardioides sp. YIM 152315]|uniref:ISL3 family transposase n=1 Tax=Nocardioides sp. YIM 152315 TaxID=3031760 RepID=UPI0023D9E3D6|nr:ISL3 family transposase [Nocardioides sp. YIM 152315]MDF1606400.1 ISL3 family transposase [Nocardioides sp. YIM 152315]